MLSFPGLSPRSDCPDRQNRPPFVTATLTYRGGDGKPGEAEAVYWGIVAFRDTAKAALMCLCAGDVAACQGRMTAGLYAKPGGGGYPGFHDHGRRCVLALMPIRTRRNFLAHKPKQTQADVGST